MAGKREQRFEEELETAKPIFKGEPIDHDCAYNPRKITAQAYDMTPPSRQANSTAIRKILLFLLLRQLILKLQFTL